MNDWERFFECSCGGEFIAVVKDDWGVDAGFIDMAFFEHGHYRPTTFWQKLKLCWKIIRTGTPYSDMVTMLPSTARDLGEYLIEITPEYNFRAGEKLDKGDLVALRDGKVYLVKDLKENDNG